MAGVRRQHRDVVDLGVKRGPFYVLFLASMPAVLVETGFVTHRQEARLLRSRAYVELLAEHLARGIAAYREEQGVLMAGAGG